MVKNLLMYHEYTLNNDMDIKFKSFLINENKLYLDQKIGDLLTALQELSDDASNLGNRTIIRAVQTIVNQIRRILHGRWDDEDTNSLKTLQKVGVALCKAIDTKEDMATIIASCAAEIEKISKGMPVNDLASQKEPDEPVDDMAGGTIDA